MSVARPYSLGALVARPFSLGGQAAAGVAVDAPMAPGMIHGFFGMFEMVPAAQGWIDHGGGNLASAFAA